MKVKPKQTPKRRVIQMHVTERDAQLIEQLRLKNRTLKDSDIFRMALDTLAEKQGLLASAS